MTVRATMLDLIDELRVMAQAGTATFTVGYTAYFSDQHIQNALDEHAIIYDFESCEDIPQRSGGTFIYKIYDTHVKHWEGTPTIMDSAGAAISTGFTFNATTGRIIWTNDQYGSARVFSGTAYDLNAAAADLWNKKAAYYADAYDVSTDNHNLRRSQLVAHAKERASYYAANANGGRGAIISAERSDT